MKKIYISERQKKHLKKAISAQDQVGGKVNAGIMDAVAGGAMCETTENFCGKTYEHANTITFITPVENGGNTTYFFNKQGVRHEQLIKALVARGIIKHFWFDKKDDKHINPYMTGRYWVDFNTISLYKTPTTVQDAQQTKLAVQQIGLDINTLDVDFWEKMYVVPFKWLLNGTLEDFMKIGFWKLEKRGDNKYFVGFNDFSNNFFDRDGNMITNTLQEGKTKSADNLVYHHGATPHREIADFKPNIQPLIMYKQFKLRLDKNGNNLAPGYVFPLYVNTEAEGVSGKQSAGLEIGKWYKSGEGECWLDTANNRLYTKGKGYGTDGNTIEKLAYRPGWHLTTTPWGNQRGDNKVVGGKPRTGNNYLNTRNSEVWAKVEICVDIDATERARAMSKDPKDQCLQSLGDREYYKYKTNTNASDDQAWYIVDMIRIVEVLDDDTVDTTNDEYYNNLLAKNPGKKINSDPYSYTKNLKNDIPYWKMPRTNGKRYSKADIEAMGYKPAEPTKINETDVDAQKYQIGFEKGGFEPYGHVLNESHEWCDSFEYTPYLKSISNFLQDNGINVKPFPRVKLHREEQEGLYVKTGYYDPDERKVHLFIADRHPKDVLRSFTHEMIHHSQNLKGMLKGYKGDTLDGDETLQKLESEAYLKGNIYFRKWTEELRPKFPNSKQPLNESIRIESNQNLLSWFGKSVVVDENGNPKPMYHGTNAEFTAFSKDFFTHGGTAYLGIGFNFVSSDITASGYGKNVHEVYLKAEHPMTNTKKTLKFNDLVQAINAIDADEDPDGSICTNILGMRIEKPTYRDVFNAAKSIYDYAESDGDIYSAVSLAYCGDNDKKIPSVFRSLFGFDSCVDYDKYSGRIQYVVVFEPNQIKSVNATNFNPDSDEMIDENFDMEEITNPEDVDLSSFDINNRLNPRFWKGGRIDSRVRIALLSIADDFVDTLDVSWAEPKDVIMTGSLANYNWTQKHSDVDLHILYDFKDIDENVSLVKEYFDSKRRLWNDEHQNITISGFQVELYVQDIHEPHASTGVYSLDKDEWLVRPNIKNFDLDYDKDAVKEKVAEYMNKIDDLCDEYDDSVADCDLSELHDKAEKLFDDIKNERRNGFEHGGGEYNVGNLIFKSLRRNGYIGKLSKIRTDTYDDMKSIYNENNEAK